MEQKKLGDVLLKLEIKNERGIDEIKGISEDILIAWLILPQE